ncbi:hypothetical protein [Protaetiibacter mangrovi]|uniref:Uncharacterized protein n=1 Tax=Protaetiibacter mangrovi TaxID=2970926 RepID=A0ABT1ZCK4_9MICO|nr:hypothetical protein [Protaetiibacter mangrovi]MCS0498432.1 hypothetical protein [Protaetiibacter mangrovi]TPX02685.1 hypothetical protein FJ656_21095 [Schumannella luteola]
MSAGAGAADADPVAAARPIHLEWVVDPGYERRRVRWRVRYAASSILVALPIRLLLAVVIVGFAVRLAGSWATLVPCFLAVVLLCEPFAGLLTTMARERRVSRLRYPSGARLTASYDHSHLVLWGPMEEHLLPYAAIRRIVEVRGFVVVFRQLGMPFIVPVELFSRPAQNLVAGRIGRVPPVQIPATEFTHHFVTDSRYARTTVRRAVLRNIARPEWWVPQAIAAAIALGMVVGGLPLVGLVAAGFVAVRCVPIMNTLDAWRPLVGRETHARFDEDGLVYAEGLESGKTDYAFFDRVNVLPALVELRAADDGSWWQYPRAVFPYGALEYFGRPGPTPLS